MVIGRPSPAELGFKILPKLPRARILKHLMEAEKSTFQGELSFQRSWCTSGLTVATIFVVCFKYYFMETVWKNIKLDKIVLYTGRGVGMRPN